MMKITMKPITAGIRRHIKPKVDRNKHFDMVRVVHL